MAKVIVIGGGIAGLKAALDLAQARHTVTLLEAKSRLGGRIYTTTASDGITPLELGAAFWEGLPNNPFYQHYFAKNGNEINKPQAKILPAKQSMIFSFNHEDRKDQFYTFAEIHPYFEKAQALLKQIESQCQGKTCQESVHLTFPASTLLQEDYWIKKCLEHELRHHATPLAKRGFGSFQIPVDHEKLESWNDNEASFCFVRGGYSKVIAQLAKACELAGVNIILNQPVTRLEDIQQKGVMVATANTQYSADKIICALPLGVLKKSAELFISPLSKEKRQAIEAMGIHEATRIILEFETPFWENVLGPYLYLDSPFFEGFKEFRNGVPLHGKAILQTDSYADIAQFLFTKPKEKEIQKRIIAQIMMDLRRAYPNAPNPHHYLLYSWSNDPYAKGAYPYRTIHMTEALQQALERPEGNIYFASADISRHGFSVHNAYASGKRAAEMIISL